MRKEPICSHKTQHRYLSMSLCVVSLLRRRYRVGPRYNESLYNEVPGITNDILQPVKSYSKMYRTEPRYNESRYKESKSPLQPEHNPEAQT